jgi:CBS domain-containing membrane protein
LILKGFGGTMEKRPILGKGESTMTTTRLKVKDLMTAQVFAMRQDDTLKDLDQVLTWKKFRHVPVTDDDSRLIGLLTHRDFLTLAISKLAKIRKEEINDLYSLIRIGDVMGKKVTSINPDALASEAAELMLKHKYGCLPVVQNEKLVGIITESDFAKAYLNFGPR